MNKKLYRSRSKKMVSGVCGGLEDYLGIDVTIIRLVWIIFSLVSSIFPGLIAYVIAAAIIPEESASDNWGGNPNTPWQDGNQWQNNGNSPWQNDSAGNTNAGYNSPYHSGYNDPTQTSSTPNSSSNTKAPEAGNSTEGNNSENNQ